MGVGFGFCTRMILRGLQRFGASAEQQIALTLACGYLSFYVANAPCKVSGEQGAAQLQPPCLQSPCCYPRSRPAARVPPQPESHCHCSQCVDCLD